MGQMLFGAASATMAPMAEKTAPHDHGSLIALAACALVVTSTLLLAARHDLQGQVRPSEAVAEIGVQHADALTLTILRSLGKADALTEFSSPQGGAVLHVPPEWTLREVRSTALDAVTMEPDGDFARYALPAGATLSFWTAGTQDLLIHNGSAAALLVVVKRLNVTTGETEEESVLVQERAVKL